MIEIHKMMHGENVVVGALDLADDGTVDFSGLCPHDAEFLQNYACVDMDKTGPVKDRLVDHDQAERWLRLLPENLHGSFCWATEARR